MWCAELLLSSLGRGQVVCTFDGNNGHADAVSLTVTVWRLSDPVGQPAYCVISERDGRWHVIVRHGRQIMIAERCPTDDAAFDRANEVWQAMVEQGWTEPRH